MNHPSELPFKPTGFTKKMNMHLNFGSDGGMGTYECFYPDGTIAPFRWQYDTRKGGLTGFLLPEIAGVMSWAELVFKWQEYVATQRQAQLSE